ncbi:hypothetical protein [Nocardia sp. NPDC057353]|uniref:hypothetical protein n=1 Tax=Nocardia sp. NPDC057353 TaxID=3346104 RepID=UPI003637382D
MKILGVAVNSGIVYYGAVDNSRPDVNPVAIRGVPSRFRPSAGLTGADRLNDTFSRITQDIRTISPDVMIVVGTRKFNQWKYAEAFERASIITILMVTSAQQGVDCLEIKTDAIGSAVGLRPDSLNGLDPAVVSFSSKPEYWNAGRAAAFAAAVAHSFTSAIV